MLLSIPIQNRPGIIAGFCETIVRRSRESYGMNFARCKCDERAVQGLMHNSAFALHIGNESRCAPQLARD